MKKPQTILYVLSFLLILTFAGITRLYGNNWDQGQHLNPDERFLTMVATEMKWTTSFSEYLQTPTSTLNPHNTKFDFYVYGTWPVILVKFISEQLNLGDYGNLTLVGRMMSGLVDLCILILVFFLGKKLSTFTKNSNHIISGLFAMTVYACMTLPIQLSHYFTTDPYLTLFLVLSLCILMYPPSLGTGLLLGLSTGLALSAKISGVLILPIIGLAGCMYLIPEVFTGIKNVYNKNYTGRKALWKSILNKCIQLALFYIAFTVIFFLSFRLLMPYLFADSGILPFSLNPKVLENWKTLKGFDNPEALFPPAVQWIHQPKLLFPFLNMFFVGIGVPLGILCGVALVWCISKIKHIPILLLISSYILIVFLYQGFQYAMPMRYFWPIYPFLAVCAGMFLHNLYRTRIQQQALPPWKSIGILCVGILMVGIWPVSVLSIYTRPHTRITASEWIYTSIPAGSRLSREHWDDPIPLNFPDSMGSMYEGEELPMYYQDTPTKWTDIAAKLEKLDYIILSSNRVYGSITSAPEVYPESTAFYEKLFSGRLGFEKVAEFSSRPRIPFPINMCIRIPFFRYGSIDRAPIHCNGIEFIDDYVDETWTVYDHPKVTIFQKKRS